MGGKKKETGNTEIIAGSGLGLLAAGEAAIGAAICPLCIIGAPILIGIGAIKKIRKKK
jgi:hypothetical protein